MTADNFDFNLKLVDFSQDRKAILESEHICNICSKFPFKTKDLYELKTHLEKVHVTKIGDYFKIFRIKISHTITELESISIDDLEIEKEKEVKTDLKVPEEEKKKYLKINGEIVKRKTISGVETYERLPRIKKVDKNGLPFYFGGLRKNVFDYIPTVDEDFLLNEEFHKDTISLLSSYGFRSILLSGDTGLGKTDTVKQICARMKQPVIALKITGNTQVKHIFQDENYSPEEKKLVKVDKAIIKAAEMGAILLVDEISAGSPSVNFTFFELLENNDYIIDLDGNKRKKHPMFKVVFTDNRIGNPNYYRYHGTQEQNNALKNRITSTVLFTNLKPSTERKILELKFPECDKKFVEDLVDVSKMVRSENEKGSLQETMPIRTLLNICSNYIVFNNAERAFYSGFLNQIIDTVDKETIKGICQRKFANGMFK